MTYQCRFVNKSEFVELVLCQLCIDRHLPATMKTNRGRRLLRFRPFREQERYFKNTVDHVFRLLFMIVDELIDELPTNSTGNEQLREFKALGVLTYKGAQMEFSTLTTRTDATRDLVGAMVAKYNKESQKYPLPPLPLMLLGKGTHAKFGIQIDNIHPSAPSLLPGILQIIN